MANVKPLGDGIATRLDKDSFLGTFPLSTEMEGFKMVSASVDETGYFLTIRWERETLAI